MVHGGAALPRQWVLKAKLRDEEMAPLIKSRQAQGGRPAFSSETVALGKRRQEDLLAAWGLLAVKSASSLFSERPHLKKTEVERTEEEAGTQPLVFTCTNTPTNIQRTRERGDRMHYWLCSHVSVGPRRFCRTWESTFETSSHDAVWQVYYGEICGPLSKGFCVDELPCVRECVHVCEIITILTWCCWHCLFVLSDASSYYLNCHHELLVPLLRDNLL